MRMVLIWRCIYNSPRVSNGRGFFVSLFSGLWAVKDSAEASEKVSKQERGMAIDREEAIWSVLISLVLFGVLSLSKCAPDIINGEPAPAPVTRAGSILDHMYHGHCLVRINDEYHYSPCWEA